MFIVPFQGCGKDQDPSNLCKAKSERGCLMRLLEGRQIFY